MTLVDGNKIINGVKVEVHANADGRWTIFKISDDDERGEAIGHGDNLDKAISMARVEINKRKVKVKVPFITVDGEKGIAHGRNVRDRRILTDIGQLDSHVRVLKADTPDEEVRRLLTITQNKKKLYSEEQALMRKYEMRLATAVDKAIEAAVPRFGEPKTRR